MRDDPPEHTVTILFDIPPRHPFRTYHYHGCGVKEILSRLGTAFPYSAQFGLEVTVTILTPGGSSHVWKLQES